MRARAQLLLMLLQPENWLAMARIRSRVFPGGLGIAATGVGGAAMEHSGPGGAAMEHSGPGGVVIQQTGVGGAEWSHSGVGGLTIGRRV
jgi:hypothetical protein